MTSKSNHKVRSIILAALMVFSVFGATVAFTGAAAAANQANGGANSSGSIMGDAIEPANVTEGTTTNNHLVRFNVTNVSGDGDTDTVNVTFNNTLAQEGLSLNSASAEFEGSNSNVAIDGSAEIVDGNTVQFDISPSASGDIEFRVDVDTNAPQVDSDTTYGVNASFEDSNGTNIDSTEVASLKVVDTDQTNTGFLSGRVSDQDNNDVQNAEVIATRNSDDLQTSTLTNDQGEYTLDLPTGTYDIRVEREGFITANSKDNAVEENKTTTSNVVITRKINADDITIVSSERTAVADGTDKVSYTVNVTTNDRENSPSALEGATVNVDSANTGLNDGNFTATSLDTDANGTATFTANSSETGEFDIEFEVASNTSVNTTTTATFSSEEGDAELTGEVRHNETAEDIEGATVWVAYQGENQTLAYAQENQEWLVSETDADGAYAINNIVTNIEGPTDVNVYVQKSGYNTVNATDSVGSYIAANDTQLVESGDTENHDFLVGEGGPPQEYTLDVTVEGQKSIEAAEGNEITATVTVEQRQKGTSIAWEAAENQEITVSLTDDGPLDPNDVNVTTDANGEEMITFTTENAGNTNITAMTTSDESVEYNTTGAEQAAVSVYGTGSITGDVVNEDDEALAAGQAIVQLYMKNSQNEYEPVKTTSGENRTSKIGSSGAYVFTDVRSNEEYRVIATTETGLTGQATTVQPIPSGTTTNDIVVEGATPSPAEFQVSELSPQNTTVTQGDTINVSANVSNVGVVDGTKTVELQVGDVSVSQDVSLNGSESMTVTFENVDTSSLDAGTYTHGVYTQADSQTGTLTVESSSNGSSLPQVAQQYDADDNGEIGLTELGAASADFSNGELGLPELGTVAQAFSG